MGWDASGNFLVTATFSESDFTIRHTHRQTMPQPSSGMVAVISDIRHLQAWDRYQVYQTQYGSWARDLTNAYIGDAGRALDERNYALTRDYLEKAVISFNSSRAALLKVIKANEGKIQLEHRKAAAQDALERLWQNEYRRIRLINLELERIDRQQSAPTSAPTPTPAAAPTTPVVTYSTPKADPTLCFTGDTPITVPGGKQIPIEAIQVNDQVVSCNMETFSCEIARVSYKWHSVAPKLFRIHVAGRVVRTTGNHPFWSADRNDWVEAQDLLPSEHLLDSESQPVAIDSIETEDGPVPVFNLEVEKNHTYYACDLLVHNCTLSVATGVTWGFVESLAVINPTTVLTAGAVFVGTFTAGTIIHKTLSWAFSGSAEKWEKSISHLPDGERQARIKEKTMEIAKHHGWEKRSDLAGRNRGRDIYEDKNGDFWSVDTRHGRFEKCNKRGKHQGEFDVDLKERPGTKDPSGGHDIEV